MVDSAADTAVDAGVDAGAKLEVPAAAELDLGGAGASD
jgi:hypothetical protein